MHALFAHPAIQAGLIPFIVALAGAELFQRLRLSGLAIIAGFAATVYFAADFELAPLTETRKIVWLGIAASILALPLTLIKWAYWRHLLATLAAIAAAWVFWEPLQQQSLVDALRWSAACALYAAWLVYWFDGLHDKPVAAGSAGLALGLGTGLAALAGGAALAGRFGLALGAASAAFLLVQLLSNSRLSCGRSFTLPLSLIAGLAGAHAVLGAQQPWYTLLALGLIPLATLIPVPEKWTVRLQTLTLSLLACTVAAGAVYLSWDRSIALF